MLIIGITGGIGTGKSEVGRILSKLGGKVIDSDVVYRKITLPGKPCYNEIISVFGNEVIAENGQLNRKKLADIVFNDKEKLLRLNTVTHKHVLNKISDEIDEVKDTGEFKFIALEVPLPAKEGFIDTVDAIWTIKSDISRRIHRIMQRGGFDRAKAKNIINSQMSDEEYDEIADVTITNNGTKAELQSAVTEELKRAGVI